MTKFPMPHESNKASAESIHHRRRSFYVLWVLLLGLSTGVWVLWNSPKSKGTAMFSLQLSLKGIPDATHAQAWLGPAETWIHRNQASAEPLIDQHLNGETLAVGPISVPIAHRRWVRDYIPNKTSDLLVLKLVPPRGEARYAAYYLSEDLRLGLLHPKARMICKSEVNWSSLALDPKAPSRVR